MERRDKVLIVENEPELAEMFAFGLREAGFETAILSDGSGVWEKIKKFKPALILLDLLMPNVDGYQVLEKVKGKTGAKIYVWSNLTREEEIRKAKRLGADGYLIKSDFTPRKLAEKIKEVLSHREKI